VGQNFLYLLLLVKELLQALLAQALSMLACGKDGVSVNDDGEGVGVILADFGCRWKWCEEVRPPYQGLTIP
jgi:hypothetical protein